MKLPMSAHTERPWRIHDIAPDFRLLDVWALPTPGGPDDFPRLVQWAVALDPTADASLPVRTLFKVRTKLGELFGWDDEASGLGARVRTLRDRVPADLAGAHPHPAFAAMPATTLYQTDDEFAAELANKTVHGIVHLGWVADGTGGYRGQLAVLVKSNGLLGRAYMAAISPFRHLIVYPGLARTVAADWATAA